MKPVNMTIWRSQFGGPKPLNFFVTSGYWGQPSNHGIRFFPMWLIPELPAHPEAGNVYLAAEVNLIAESLFEKRSNVVNRVVPFVFGTSEPSSSIQLQRKLN